MTPSTTLSNVLQQLRTFLLAVLPEGTEVVTAEVNRVPEPAGGLFVVMTPIHQGRLRTNEDGDADSKFTASIAANVMTVTAFDPDLDAPIEVGSPVFGVSVANGTVVVALGTGSGGTGTYQVAPSQAVASETMSAGRKTAEQGVEHVIQLDFHGDQLAASDMATTVSTLIRDEYGVEQFAGQSPNYGVVPLYADDPKQMPFINENQQYEWRWVLEAMLQANPVVIVPQQYADSVQVQIVDVDATYPP